MKCLPLNSFYFNKHNSFGTQILAASLAYPCLHTHFEKHALKQTTPAFRGSQEASQASASPQSVQTSFCPQKSPAINASSGNMKFILQNLQVNNFLKTYDTRLS